MANRAEKRRQQRQQGGGRAGENAASSSFRRILLAVGVIAIGVIAWNVFLSGSGEGAREPVELDLGPQELVAMAQGVEKGDPDAPITVMDFSDYQCPSCAGFTSQAKPFLEVGYVDEGLVQFVYYDYPIPSLHPHAFLAARAARCAGDVGDYWDYHDELFRRQAEWARQSDPFSTFVDYAANLGFPRGEFRSCLGSDRFADVVTANMQLGQQLGVSGTPTLFLDTGEGRGERVSDWSPNALSAQLDAALERVGAEPPDEIDPDTAGAQP